VNSTQLDLWEADLAATPWGGQSPRVLTRSHKRFILKPEAQKRERFFTDPCQLEMFADAIKKAPWKYQGAPLLKEV